MGDFSLCLLDDGFDGGGEGDDTRSKSLEGVCSSLDAFCFLFPFLGCQMVIIKTRFKKDLAKFPLQGP